MIAYLLLENGTVFTGKAFGAQKVAVAELVFNTQVVGYLETLTDPNYVGQAVVQTFPEIGNYGVIHEDLESEKGTPAAYIVRNLCDNPSNFRCEGKLNDFMVQKGIPGIYGIDTRALTRMLRAEGTMNGLLTYTDPTADKEALIKTLKAYKIENAVSKVTCDSMHSMKKTGNTKTVAVLDLGIKNSILHNLLQEGFDLDIYPAAAKAEDILKNNPDGIFLSDGPANPKDNMEVVAEIAKLTDSGKPMLGCGLGHLLLALAKGGDTEKLPFGHHGANQPVKNFDNGKTYITTQNTNYTVVPESVKNVFMVNANDKSVEAVSYGNNIWSCQFQPEFERNNLNTSFIIEAFKNAIC